MFPRVLCSLTALLCLRAVAAEPAPARPPNIVLIVTDDQRSDTIHALGDPIIHTPHLDALAQRGFVFTRAANQGANNGAVCVPARAMLLSGRTLWRVDSTLARTTTLGGFFGAHGYATFGTGKWHNGQPSLAASFQNARNITAGFLGTGHSDDYATLHIADGTVTKGRNTARLHSTDLIGQTAVDFLATRKGQPQPFFLYVAFNAPHDPRQAPGEWTARYRDADGRSTVPLPANFLPAHPFDNGDLAIRDEQLLPRPRDPAAVREQLAIYYGMISHLDDWVGKITRALRDAGLGENTLLVFTSDHGLALGSHGLLGKQNLYEHSLGVPLIFAGPGIPAGKSDALTLHPDIYPTLADFAGLRPQLPAGQIEGRTLRPVITGAGPAPRASTYHGYLNKQRALRSGPWKLIEYDVAGTRTAQLFDLATDPHEMTDLATRPEHAAQLAGLRAGMDEARTAHGDTGWGKSAPAKRGAEQQK